MFRCRRLWEEIWDLWRGTASLAWVNRRDEQEVHGVNHWLQSGELERQTGKDRYSEEYYNLPSYTWYQYYSTRVGVTSSGWLSFRGSASWKKKNKDVSYGIHLFLRYRCCCRTPSSSCLWLGKFGIVFISSSYQHGRLISALTPRFKSPDPLDESDNVDDRSFGYFDVRPCGHSSHPWHLDIGYYSQSHLLAKFRQYFVV